MAEIKQQLPKEISDFINSGEAITEIDEIAEKAEIENVSGLYTVVFQLIRKDIPAAEFINELTRELGWDKEMSVAVAHEIKEKVLNKIKYAIKDWGVDIEDIETPNPTPLEKLSLSSILSNLGIEVPEKREAEERPEPESKEEKTINLSKDLQSPETGATQVPISKTQQAEKPEEEKEEKKVEPKPSVPQGKEAEEKPADKPFMLHQEEGGGQTQERQNVERRKRSFSFSKDGFFGSEKENEEQAPKAQIETPGSKTSNKKGGGFFSFGKKKKGKDKKVVHYSDNRTDLSNDDNGSFISLSDMQPNQKKQESAPNSKQEKQKSFNESFQKSKTGGGPEQNKKGDLALGNVNESNKGDEPIKKDFSQEEKRKGDDSNDGPHIDGNTVDLSKK